MEDFSFTYFSSDNYFSIEHKLNCHPKESDFALHKHKSYEIYLLLQGAGSYYIEGNYYELQPGNLLMMNYNELHTLKINEQHVYERIVMQLSDNITTPFANRDVDFFFPIKNRPLGHGNLIPADIVKKHQLDTYIHRILELYQQKSTENEILAQCTIIQLLLSLKKAYIPLSEYAHTKKVFNNKIEAILDYINNNLGTDLSLDVLSERFYISKYYLCHIFKESTGFSLNQYISLKRVIYASSLIAAGQSSTAACFACGFNDYSSFYKAYKKFMNCSPMESKLNHR